MKKKVIISVSVIVAVLLIVLAAVSPFIMTSLDKGYYADGLYPQKIQTGNPDYQLTLDQETGCFTITHKQTQAVWKSNPENWQDDETARDIWRGALNSQLMVRYLSSDGMMDEVISSYTASVKDGNATFQLTENGFHAEYYFEEQGFTIPLDIILNEEGMEASVAVNEIENTSGNVIAEIRILPFFGAGGVNDQGYLMLPSGSGGIIAFNNGRNSSGDVTINVYGEDLTLAGDTYIPTVEYARLPVFGLANQNHSFLAVIEHGDALASIKASVSGGYTDYNNIYPSFSLAGVSSFYLQDFTGQDREFIISSDVSSRLDKISVQYLFLEDSTSYSDMAKAYRDYLVDYYELKPDAAANKISVDLYGSVLKDTLIFGFIKESPVALSDYEKVKEFYDLMKENTGQPVTLNLANFLKDALYANRISSDKTVSCLGNRSVLESIEDAIFYSIDPVFVNSSYSSAYIAKTTMNLTAQKPVYDLETNLRVTTDVDNLLAPNYIGQSILDMAKFSGQIRFCVDTVGENLLSDFGKNKYSKQDSKNIISSALQELRQSADSLMTTGGNFYSALSSTEVTDIPVDSGKSMIINYSIPFYQMVMSEFVSISGTAVNLSANPQYQFLKTLESGSGLHYTFILSEGSMLKDTDLTNLCGSEFRLWKDTFVQQIKEMDKINRITAGSGIDRHEIVEENVTRTVYQNGAEIIINYNETSVSYGGQKIGSMDYLLIGGE